MKILPRQKGYLIASLALPVLHLCACLIVGSGILGSEGSWGWFPMFVVDFPFSIALLPVINGLGPAPAFVVLGTIWWFVLSRGAVALWSRLRERRS